MTWFLLAIVGPFLYALTNHIDKLLLNKYFKKGGVGTLILFSSLLSFFALPIIYIFEPSVFSVGLGNILILSVVGLLNIMLLWFYLLALKNDEASVVIVFYQLVPLIGLILGYFILDEVITQIQFIAMTVIILGTTIISFEIDEKNNLKFRKLTVLYMLAASTCWALAAVIFKFVALEENVLKSLFWEHVVLTTVGLLIFITIRPYRDHFLQALKVNSKSILSLNFLNEGLYIAGNIVVSFAYLLAPIALILLAESFQPVFVLIIAVILTIFFPRISKEKITAKHLGQKLFAIAITGVGTFLLLTS